jgi:hypothetical protein
LAEDEQKYEVTGAVQGWLWQDEKCDKNAPDICLMVAAAFSGALRLQAAHFGGPRAPHPKK